MVISVISLVIPVISVISVNRHTVLKVVLKVRAVPVDITHWVD